MTEFERCSAWIEAALEYNDGYTLEDIAADIAADRAQFWPGKKSAAVTQIIDLPQKRVLHVMLAGGDMDELKLMMKSAEAWGRALGASEITMTGRRGWERALGDWSFQGVTLGKPL